TAALPLPSKVSVLLPATVYENAGLLNCSAPTVSGASTVIVRLAVIGVPPPPNEARTPAAFGTVLPVQCEPVFQVLLASKFQKIVFAALGKIVSVTNPPVEPKEYDLLGSGLRTDKAPFPAIDPEKPIRL